MIETHPLDTPINRASIDKLPIEDMLDYIERIQARRLKPLAIYEAGLLAKERSSKEKAAVDLDKRLTQFVNAHTTVMNGLAKMEKYAQEIQGYRLLLGDDIRNEEK